MATKSSSKSRRETPWDGDIELTPMQKFLKTEYGEHCKARHMGLNESGEADMINSFAPKHCPYCGSALLIKRGYTANGIQRYHILRRSKNAIFTIKCVI
ncbi:hypothetical protein AGMMS49975_20270 [Clostridia bacterium]|nr:hypothetical protein AGMMS49975_20270 [Clostridia bacterium]